MSENKASSGDINAVDDAPSNIDVSKLSFEELLKCVKDDRLRGLDLSAFTSKHAFNTSQALRLADALRTSTRQVQ